MVAAPILPGRRDALHDLLMSMNRRPGEADPANALVPFGRFRRLHFARFVILDDQTLEDLSAYGKSFPGAPLYLVFLGDCDGPATLVLTELANLAAPGLRRIFGHCEGFAETTDLRSWMRSHRVRAAASYVNFPGRTVRQIREEAALHAVLKTALGTAPPQETPLHCLARLRIMVQEYGPIVSPPAPSPVLYRVRRFAADVLAGLVLLIAAVLLLLTPLILLIPVFLHRLRKLENSDPVIAPLAADAHIGVLASQEDLDLVNQFSAFGSVKPGVFRSLTLACILFALDFANRVIYTRGRLARIGTIHFARWVFLDGRRRLLFASNYDRSLETYADDFVNKVAFGINLVFSNGIGFPRTRFLLLEGAKNERNYQHYLRRHQIVTEVWYNAYPGLTAFEINRNARIRAGLFDTGMTPEQIRLFLALI